MRFSYCQQAAPWIQKKFRWDQKILGLSFYTKDFNLHDHFLCSEAGYLKQSGKLFMDGGRFIVTHIQ